MKQYDAQSFEQDIRKILNDLGDVLVAKNQDYGNSVEKSIDKWGLPSLAQRIEDKYNRFENLIRNGGEGKVQDEKLEDTLLDLAGYAILGYRKMKKEQAIKAYSENQVESKEATFDYKA